VTRQRDPADERSLAVGLTEQGRALRAEAEKIPPAIVARLGLPIADLESLHAALTRVISAAR
jgi:MarR family transcriptional regulator, organic hydroperoxide resistance regulator